LIRACEGLQRGPSHFFCFAAFASHTLIAAGDGSNATMLRLRRPYISIIMEI
jgi:hypothetical protein